MPARKLLLMAACLASPLAGAGTLDWIGLDGAWEDSANWSGGALPQADDLVTIAHTGAVGSSAAGNRAGQLETHAVLGVSAGDLGVTGTIDTFGALSVSAGASLTAGRIIIHDGGSLTGTGTGALINVDKGVYNEAGATLRMAQGAQLTANSFDNLHEMHVESAAHATASSMINHAGGNTHVQGVGTQLAINGALTNDGAIDVDNNATLRADTLDNHGTLDITTGHYVGHSAINTGHITTHGANDALKLDDVTTNRGTIELNGGSATIANLDNHGTFVAGGAGLGATTIENQSDGSVELTDGAQVNVDDRVINRNALTIRPFAQLSTASFQQLAGRTLLVGARLDASSQFGLQVAGGELAGYGDLTGSLTVTQTGRVAPGIAAGESNSISVSSNFTMLGGTYAVDLLGTPGFLYDRLFVYGDVTLGGRLEVNLGGGFTPVAGDHFDIISDAHNIIGAFASVVLPTIDPGLHFLLSMTGGTVRLSVAAVPLPGAAWGMLPALLVLARRRRARQHR